MRPNHNQIYALTMAALACASGCADDASARGESATLAVIDDPSGAEAGDAGSVDGGLSNADPLDGGLDASRPDAGRGNPEGAYFASVVANGSGCPAGTWNTSISDDGQRFTLVFSAYEVSINDTTADLTVSRNCFLSIAVHGPSGLSFSVKSAQFTGYGFLEQGVTGSFWARYSFQGNPIPPTGDRNRLNVVGPYDSDFIYKDIIPAAEAVWSPCGLQRDLNINTTLQIKNSQPKRSGYMNVAADQGTTFSLELAWRACTAATSGKQ